MSFRKKLISIFLAVVLLLSAGVPAFADVAKLVPVMNCGSLNLKQGESAQLTVTLGNTDVTAGMLWTSDTPAVATISHGTVSAAGPGTATVTATTGDGRSTRCTVRVGIRGIDVSKYQGAISWSDVKNSGIVFALLRTGYGNEQPDTQTDELFDNNYNGAVASGIRVGAYHHSEALTPEEAVVEAHLCLNILNGRHLDYPVFVDVETEAQKALSTDQISAVAAAFCGTVQSAGYQAGVYSNADILQNKLTGAVLDGYAKWVAHYNVLEPRYSGSYQIWQYTNAGTVSGIPAGVDLDYSYQDYPNPAPVANDITFLSDSPSSLTLQRGKTYVFKFTPNGISGTPSFQTGNSGVLKVVSAGQSGGCYYVKISAVGTGATALYSLLPGKDPARRCIVTVQ